MTNMVDDTIEKLSGVLFGNSGSIGFFTYFNFGKFLSCAFVSGIVFLIIFRLFRSAPITRLFISVAFSLCYFVLANVMQSGKELVLASGIFMFLILARALYLFLLWLPVRFQYNPAADARIEELLLKGVLSQEENDELYLLRRQGREAYDRNVDWLFRSGGNRNKEKY